MPSKPNTPNGPADLRHRAELHLRGQRSKPAPNRPQADNQRLLHELEVHQVELELQNAELQNAGNKLEMALEKYTDLYDFAPVGYFSVDELGVILEANLTGASLLGIERSRLIKRRLPLLALPASQPDLLAFLKVVFSGTTNQVCEALLQKEGGGAFWAGFRAASAVSLKGRQKWCRVAFGDITHRKQAEEERGRLAAIVASSEDAIISTSLNGIIASWNAGAERLFGYTAQKAIGRPITLLLPRNRMDEEPDLLERIRRGDHLKHYETVRRRKDGRLLDVSLTVSPILDSQGRIVGVSKIARDITEKKRAEAAQRRSEMLAASNRKLEQEMVRRRTVEAALKQTAQHERRLLVQSRCLQEQQRHLAHQVLLAQEKERKRISRELHDVIAQTLMGVTVHLAGLKTRATTNPKGLEQSITRTQRLVKHSLKIIHQFARELRPAMLDDLGLIPALNTFVKHFRAETGLRVSLSAEVIAEQVQGDKRTVLYRVAQEALTNIARHARASRADVKIQQLDRTVCMTITDDGKGFQAEHVLQTKKSKRLGLLGMRERLEMVRGSFTVQSAPGKGTTVRVQIPLAGAGGGRRGRDRVSGQTLIES
ncbi:MAG: PAS domain S-box protein [Verrucomicrobia bacterium]|nr:PAS domain S-box protein [Verrucomicrobiota bacterium]